MKYLEESEHGIPMIELTERNLYGLLEKLLDDPNSACTLIDRDHKIAVKAVRNEEHYTARPPGPMYTRGEYK